MEVFHVSTHDGTRPISHLNSAVCFRHAIGDGAGGPEKEVVVAEEQTPEAVEEQEHETEILDDLDETLPLLLRVTSDGSRLKEIDRVTVKCKSGILSCESTILVLVVLIKACEYAIACFGNRQS